MLSDLNKALVQAAASGCVETARRLLAEGADPRSDYSVALRSAVRNGHLEVVRLLLPMSDPKAGNSNALQVATLHGYLEIVRLLLPMSDPKAEDSYALQMAAQNGYTEIVRLLLPVSDPTVDSSWALRLAAENGHLEIVKLLLPLSNVGQLMFDPGFIKTSGCDFLLSCLPLAKAKKFVATHPSLALPRSRAMLGAQSLRRRPATTATIPRRRV